MRKIRGLIRALFIIGYVLLGLVAALDTDPSVYRPMCVALCAICLFHNIDKIGG